MNNEHTPEPWKVSNSGGLIQPCNGNPIAVICRGFGMDEEDFPNWKANARRIVACVNACEGIPIDRLEAGKKPIAEDFMWMYEENKKVTAIYRELLEALEGVVNKLTEMEAGSALCYHNGCRKRIVLPWV